MHALVLAREGRSGEIAVTLRVVGCAAALCQSAVSGEGRLMPEVDSKQEG